MNRYVIIQNKFAAHGVTFRILGSLFQIRDDRNDEKATLTKVAPVDDLMHTAQPTD